VPAFYALEHATSVAANLATVPVIIPEEEEKGPDEGYADIAKAITFFGKLYNQQHAIMTENKLEAYADQERMLEALQMSGN
jgi:hypothetical protein